MTTKTVPSGLQSQLTGQVSTLAQLCKITRADGTVYAFADHDKDIVFDGVTYLANPGMTSSALTQTGDLSIDNLEVQGVLDAASLTEEDLIGGRYDEAAVEFYLINWADPSDGAIRLPGGKIGPVRMTERGKFVAEIRGLAQAFAQNIVEVTSPGCRARLGDDRCGVDVPALTVTGTITNVSGRRILGDTSRAEATNYWRGGKITMTSGDCDGLAMEVKSFAVETGVGVLRLALPFPFDVAVGDGYSLEPGCDYTIETCNDTFDNVLNFRGEPHIPGMRKALAFKVPPG